MKQLYDDLWQTKVYSPFGSLRTFAYFLQCPEGNVLIYSTGHADEIQHMAELGGIQYQYLSHRDETGPSLKEIREQFNSKLCCHLKEKPSIDRSCPVDVTFTEDVTHFSQLKILHTPGHTDGSISFVYPSPSGKTYLFTGDTLFPSERGGWASLYFSRAGGSAETLRDSLLIYRALSPDVVMWSGSSTQETHFELTQDEWQKSIDETIRKLDSR